MAYWILPLYPKSKSKSSSAVANAIVPAKGVGLSFTPTTATYNPETGMFSATIGKHGLHPGDYVKFLAGGVTFSCDTGSGPQNDAVPAPSHPFYNHPCSVESVTATTITMFVVNRLLTTAYIQANMQINAACL